MSAAIVASATVAASTVAAAVTTGSVEPSSLASIVNTVVPGIIASALPSAVTTSTPLAAVTVQVPHLLELTAAFIGGLSGAWRAVDRRMDISGVVVLAIVNALGGGIVRDVLLQDQGIAAFQHWTLLAAALLAALVSFFFSSIYVRLHRPFRYFDALSLGLFAVVGTDKALSAHLAVIPAILLGIVTSVGGGLMRDLLCNEVPQVLKPGTLSATAAVAGTLVYVILGSWLHIVKPIALVLAAGTTVVLRVLAIHRGWRTPRPLDLLPARGSTPQSIHEALTDEFGESEHVSER